MEKKKVLIIYNSQKGTTKKYGNEIGKFLRSEDVDSKVISISEFNASEIDRYDSVMLGCWTSGLLVCMQHPQQEWTDFAKKLPDLKNKKIGFFTTYKIATGSMFKKMKMHLKDKISGVSLEIKSRNGLLSESNIKELMSFAQ
jgi:flavodoxin